MIKLLISRETFLGLQNKSSKIKYASKNNLKAFILFNNDFNYLVYQ
jgi:hypothetical protein